CVAYLWFFGFQTLIVLEARYLTRKTPAVSMAPAQLADFSISRWPGRKLSYFGYEFEVPWNDVDEAKSGLIPVSNKAMIVFQFGRPANPSGEVSVRLFSDSSSFNFIFIQKAGAPALISQPDINRILHTLHKAT